jgi:hypothetical protein
MAIVQFAFANVNDPLVSIGFFSHPTFRAREVVFGQCRRSLPYSA